MAGFVPIRVNAGGPAYTDSHRFLWAADTGYSGGSAFTTTQNVGNTSRAVLYQSERNSSGTLQYRFDSIPPGTYTVNMRFAELVYTAPGQRVFEVGINGQTMRAGYDIFAAAGRGFWATDLSFAVAVSGQITIELISVVKNAKIDAIEILQNSAAPIGVTVSPASAILSQAQSKQFTATVTGSTSQAVTWSMTPVTGTLVNGLYTAPSVIPAQQTLTLKATSAADGITSAVAAVTLIPVQVSVSPAAASLLQGQSQQFTATVAGTTNPGVTWSITPAVGSVVNGLYTAPAAVTSAQTIVVKATSAVDGSAAGSATVSLTPLQVSVSPAAMTLTQGQSKQFTATVTGNVNQAVTWSMTPVAGTLVNGLYTAPATIAGRQTISVTATSVVDGSTSGVTTVTLMPLQVSVSPAAVTLSGGQSQQFTATTTGGTNPAVTWLMTPQVGTLINGLYTAPASITTQQTVTVKATSAVDGTTSSVSSVTLIPGLAPFTPIRVNAGGPAYTDTRGFLWTADTGYNGGTAYTTTQNVSNTTKPFLYQSERNSSGTLQYDFNAIPAGAYSVNLRFAELVYSAPGERVFEISINGSTVQAGYDIVAAAGVSFRATDLSFPVAVTNGQITIRLISVIQNAKIGVIEILQTSAAAPISVGVSPTAATLSQGQSQQFLPR